MAIQVGCHVSRKCNVEARRWNDIGKSEWCEVGTMLVGYTGFQSVVRDSWLAWTWMFIIVQTCISIVFCKLWKSWPLQSHTYNLINLWSVSHSKIFGTYVLLLVPSGLRPASLVAPTSYICIS
jgi:uncharacterized membrane protein YhaH (DUF805 family)